MPWGCLYHFRILMFPLDVRDTDVPWSLKTTYYLRFSQTNNRIWIILSNFEYLYRFILFQVISNMTCWWGLFHSCVCYNPENGHSNSLNSSISIRETFNFSNIDHIKRIWVDNGYKICLFCIIKQFLSLKIVFDDLDQVLSVVYLLYIIRYESIT